jgi:hypothetical protein
MEDELKPTDSFAPSIFAAATEMTQAEGFQLPTGTSIPLEVKIEIDEETAQICAELPFDIAAYLTHVPEVKLVESEAKKLGRLWRRPLERLLAKNPNSDIILAAYVTAGIAAEKYAEFKLSEQRRNRTRAAGSGENEQSQG